MKTTKYALALILLTLANCPQRALADSFVINDTSGTAILVQNGTNDTVKLLSTGPPGANTFIWSITQTQANPIPAFFPIADEIFGTDGVTEVGQLTIESAAGPGTPPHYNITFTGCDPVVTTTGCPAFSPLGTLTEVGSPSTTTAVDIPTPLGTDSITVVSAALNQVPEPSTVVLLGTGLLGLAGAMRRKRLA